MRPRHRAFTLAECLFASVLLLSITLAIGSALVGAQQQASTAFHLTRAVDLLSEMMQRITALPYGDPDGATLPGPEAGEGTPRQYDNMDDYNGSIEMPGQVANALGEIYPQEYQAFRRSVTAEYASREVPGLGTTVQGLAVAVTVTDDHGQSWSLARFVPVPP